MPKQLMSPGATARESMSPGRSPHATAKTQGSQIKKRSKPLIQVTDGAGGRSAKFKI